MNKTTLLKLSQTWLRQLGASMVVTFLFALLASNAHATLQAYEPFNYTGTFVNPPSGTLTQTAGGGYTGGWTVGGGATYSIVSGLSYPGLLSANGALSVNQPNGGNYIHIELPVQTLLNNFQMQHS